MGRRARQDTPGTRPNVDSRLRFELWEARSALIRSPRHKEFAVLPGTHLGVLL